MAGRRQRLKAVGEKDRDDAAPDGRSRIEPRVMREIDEQFGIVAQPFNAPRLFLHQLESGLRRRRDDRREADAINESRQGIAQPIDHRLPCRRRNRRKSTRVFDKVPIIRSICCGSTPACSQRPRPSLPRTPIEWASSINSQALCRSLRLDQPRKVGDIAIHAVEALGDDQRIAVIGALFAQKKIQMVEIIVAKNDGFGRRAFGPAHNAIVRQFVDEQRIVRAKDMGNRRHIGEIAADQRQSLLDAEEFGEARLQIMMRGTLAANEAGAEGADPQGLHGRRRRRDDRGVRGEPEIVIIGETDEAAACCLGFTPQSVDRREKTGRRGRDTPSRRAGSASLHNRRGCGSFALCVFGGPDGVTNL